MKSLRLLAAFAALFTAAACHDNSTTPVVPASISLSAGADQHGTVGQTLAVAPTFVVYDANGKALNGVRVSVAVSAGGGTLTAAPTRTVSGATSVGAWTLGPSVGTQSITVTVGGLAPFVISATAAAGAPAKLVAVTPAALSAKVGDVIVPAPQARLTDTFGNPIASTAIAVAAPNTASAPTSVTSGADGLVTIPGWNVGTIAGQSALTLSVGSASLAFVATVAPGDPASLTVDNTPARALAGSVLDALAVRVVDRYGNTISGQSATFTAVSGGGTMVATSANASASGAITVPAWTLGKSAVTQSVHVTAGALSKDIAIPITSDYNIDVRFFGPAMTDEQRGWFTNAAARIRGVVTGDVPDAGVIANISEVCGVSGAPAINERIDDILIFASIAPIDGPGKILAEAGPCVLRSADTGLFTLVGVMLFDSADMASMAANGTTQDVITHEMLHVVGIGTLWQDKYLITAAGTTSVTYWGAQARQGCVGFGGTATCATSVPVENNLVIGTADSHWRESTFGNELMTGYVNTGGMPFSAMTVGSLADIGYQVNLLAADAYRLPSGSASSGNLIPGRSATDEWEKRLPQPIVLGGSSATAPSFVRRP